MTRDDEDSERSRTIRYQIPGRDKRTLFARSGIE